MYSEDIYISDDDFVTGDGNALSTCNKLVTVQDGSKHYILASHWNFNNEIPDRDKKINYHYNIWREKGNFKPVV